MPQLAAVEGRARWCFPWKQKECSGWAIAVYQVKSWDGQEEKPGDPGQNVGKVSHSPREMRSLGEGGGGSAGRDTQRPRKGAEAGWLNCMVILPSYRAFPAYSVCY